MERIEDKIVDMPRVKFYGISVWYPISGQADGSNPPLHALWVKAGKDGLWDVLQAQSDNLWLSALVGVYYNLNKNDDGCFSYAVGMFYYPQVELPEELFCSEFSACSPAVCMFRYGENEDIWALNPHGLTEQYLQSQGLVPVEDGWCAESYHDDLCKPGEACLGYWIAAYQPE